MGTTLDPTLTKQDRLVGQVMGVEGNLPDVYIDVEIDYFLMKRLVGKSEEESGNNEGESGKKKPERIQNLKKDEVLLLNIGSTTTKVYKHMFISNPSILNESTNQSSSSMLISFHLSIFLNISFVSYPSL